jgi:hypothetical protein
MSKNIYIELKTKVLDRTKFAAEVAFMFNGEEIGDFPYMPNENDDSFWTIDRGNDWKIGFDRKDKKKFYIMYRYGGYAKDENEEETEQDKFVKLLAAKYNGQVII